MDRLLIRADGNEEIGSGHIVRCSAIAAEAEADGCEAVFAVCDGAGRALAEKLGFRCEVVGSDPRRFGRGESEALAALSRELGAGAILVDSYAVTDEFFQWLAQHGEACAYIDDAYTFEGGFQHVPARREVAAVVNYGFGFDAGDYRAAYEGSETNLHIGPRYAPVRDEFRDVAYEVRREVGSVLVTSGMTNPDGALERMAAGCREALPDARIVVVVGGMAEFDGACLAGPGFEVVSDVRDMRGLMAGSDLAVSAAGSTLYELACIGVPVVAAPVVENQRANADGLEGRGLGRSLRGADWGPRDVAAAVAELAGSYELRRGFSSACRRLVDGRGARRVYEAMKALWHVPVAT